MVSGNVLATLHIHFYAWFDLKHHASPTCVGEGAIAVVVPILTCIVNRLNNPVYDQRITNGSTESPSRESDLCLREHGGTKPRYCNGDLTCDSRVRLNSNGEEEFAQLGVRKTIRLGLQSRLLPRVRDISIESQLMISLNFSRKSCIFVH